MDIVSFEMKDYLRTRDCTNQLVIFDKSIAKEEMEHDMVSVRGEYF